MTPIVSIVVPCFDVENYLGECVTSVLQQSLDDIELILVDDGSTDSTPMLADECGARDPRVVVVHQPNRGLGGARNTGVRTATGKYLFFLDSDDVLPADALQRMVSSAEESCSDFVSGVAMKFTAERQWKAAMYRSPFRTDRFSTHLFYEPDLLYDHIACSKLFRRSFWDEQEFEFPEGVLFEDIELVTRAHCTARSVDLLSTPTYLWREREQGAQSITQDRTRAGSTTARFAALGRIDTYLRDHAPINVWEAHGAKVFSMDVPVYCRLIADNDRSYLDEFKASAGALARTVSPTGITKVNVVNRKIWQALLDDDEAALRACAELLIGRHTGSLRRRWRGSRRLGGDVARPRHELLKESQAMASQTMSVIKRRARRIASIVGTAIVDLKLQRDASAISDNPEVSVDDLIDRSVTSTRRLEDRARRVARKVGVLPTPQPGRRAAANAPDAVRFDCVGTISARVGTFRDRGVILTFSEHTVPVTRAALLHETERIVLELPSAAGGSFSLNLGDLRRFGREATLRPGTWRTVAVDSSGRAWIVTSDSPARHEHTDAEAGAEYRLRADHAGINVSVASLLPPIDRPARAQTAIRATHTRRAASGARRRAIFYECYYGRSVGCHPRAIFEALRKRLPDDVEHVFVTQPGFLHAPEGATTAQRWTRRYHDYLRTSPLIVSNCELHRTFTRAHFQTVVQTWHGTPLKRIGLDIDAPAFRNQDYQADLAHQVAQWSMMVSPTDDTDQIFRRAFGYEGELLSIGSPRNDRLVRNSVSERDAIRADLSLETDDLAALFAPTFRDDAHGPGGYAARPQCDLRTLLRSLPDNAKVLFRAHSNIRSSDIPWNEPRVVNVSDYPDAQDLILAGDVLVTDYSSMMFDWSLTHKPLVLFAPDLDQYRDVRNFYYDYESLISDQIATKASDLERQLAAAIIESRQDLSSLVATFAHRDDGRATERLVDEILDRVSFD